MGLAGHTWLIHPTTRSGLRMGLAGRKRTIHSKLSELSGVENDNEIKDLTRRERENEESERMKREREWRERERLCGCELKRARWRLMIMERWKWEEERKVSSKNLLSTLLFLIPSPVLLPISYPIPCKRILEKNFSRVCKTNTNPDFPVFMRTKVLTRDFSWLSKK